jgi:hypothetical protein
MVALMVTFADGMNLAAPIYNLALAAIVVFMFIKLFRTRPVLPVYMTPWHYMFGVICVFILEEIITVLRATGVFVIEAYINGFFELVIVSLLIYLLLLQREHIIKNREH